MCRLPVKYVLVKRAVKQVGGNREGVRHKIPSYSVWLWVFRNHSRTVHKIIQLIKPLSVLIYRNMISARLSDHYQNWSALGYRTAISVQARTPSQGHQLYSRSGWPQSRPVLCSSPLRWPPPSPPARCRRWSLPGLAWFPLEWGRATEQGH